MAPREPGLSWSPRPDVLAPRAVAATGAVADGLARRLRELTPAHLARLSAVAGEDLLLLLGEASDLPWVEGVIYLGRSAAAPSLLLPTQMEPAIPEGLLERAVRRRFPDVLPPVAVMPDGTFLVSAAAARPLDQAAVDRFRGPQRAGIGLAPAPGAAGKEEP